MNAKELRQAIETGLADDTHDTIEAMARALATMVDVLEDMDRPREERATRIAAQAVRHLLETFEDENGTASASSTEEEEIVDVCGVCGLSVTINGHRLAEHHRVMSYGFERCAGSGSPRGPQS